MGIYLDETLADLRTLLDDVRRQASDVGYGFFPGGDPRAFVPDPDASTEAEREAHRIDCERAERGEGPLTKTGHEIQGAAMVHFSGYGLGTYTMEDPAMQDVAERLERAIDQLERATEETRVGRDG